jgi:hypothetical protein
LLLRIGCRLESVGGLVWWLGDGLFGSQSFVAWGF